MRFSGGKWGGKWPQDAPKRRSALRCLGGGILMGCGSLLIPGGNDALVLLAMPSLWPHGWAAFAVMCTSVACALWWRMKTAAG